MNKPISVNKILSDKAEKLAGKPVKFAVVGGSGFKSLDQAQKVDELAIDTPYSTQAVIICLMNFEGCSFAFLPRHGNDHSISPHDINYRANIWALKNLGVESVLAFNAVGGIHRQLPPGSICLPDQIIDYSYGREQTFFDGKYYNLDHIDFSEPLKGPLYQHMAALLGDKQLSAVCYACTQGPRLETAAEIKRLKRDGADIVGMTLMPEAALAREAGLDYCSLAMVVNWAAGLESEAITLEEIYRQLDLCKVKSLALLWRLLPQIDGIIGNKMK